MGHSEAGAAVARVEDAPDSPSRVTALGEVLDRLAQRDAGFAAELRQQLKQARGAGVNVKGITQTAVGNQNVQLADVQGTLHVSYLGHKRLARLAPADVRAFVAGRAAAGLAAATVRQIHAILRAALAHAVREDLLPRNVARLVVVPTGPRHEVTPLTPEEARRLLIAARGDRLYALWAVAIALGLRRGEALGLRWADVDLDSAVLHVRQSLQRANGSLQLVPPKTVRSRRSIPLPAVTLAALKEHRRRMEGEAAARGSHLTPGDFVFMSTVGTPSEPRNVNRASEALLQRSGVRRVRLHDLRHTCASLLLAQGVPARVVMETLGHSAIAVTMNTYSHVLPSLQREATDRMNDALS